MDSQRVPPWTIRRAGLDDADALSAIKLLTFREAFLEDFAIPYPPADLARFEEDSYGPARVSAELADPAHATWIGVAADGALMGYAHAGPCKLPHRDATPNHGELYQLYLRRDAQGIGLGRALLDTALVWLSQAFPGPLWIGVWSGNERAQAVYAARGFRKVGGYGFMVGNHRDEEHILRRD